MLISSSVHLLIYSGEEGSPCRASLCRHWQPKARDSLVQRGDTCNDGADDGGDDGGDDCNDGSYSSTKPEIHRARELIIT